MDVEFEGQKFVSSRDIDRERTRLSEARQRVLDHEERKYHSRKTREEEAFARGDHKWMLPGLEKDLEKKKKKKHKKEKKKKKDKDRNKSEESEDEWVESEKNVPVAREGSPQQERDSFLEFGLMNTYSKSDVQRQSKLVKQQEAEEHQKKAASRELNPSLRAGSGEVARTGGGVKQGDGGLGWLLKAFRRAEDQAGEGGQSLEEIAEKRWGSLPTFLDMVNKARDKAAVIDGRTKTELKRLTEQYGLSSELEDSGYKERRIRKRETSRERRRRSQSRSRSRERRRERSRSRDRRRSRERYRSRSRSEER